ncbi:DUF488 domain-containing protein [Rhizobium sp. AC27/96]|uniref:DUF488 domain-containing protein n=1 Tax=unclassified Rhizobium TaxID=2613769 RepID=UPI0031B9E758
MNELVEEGERRVCAIMCSEAVWWRCHRRLIADNLLAREETVFHIMGSRIYPASLTPGALVHRDYRVTYPKTTYVVEDLDCSSQP